MARPTLLSHRKFARLARAVGGRAVALGSLELLWAAAYESGDDEVGGTEDVEAAAEWAGETGVMFAALRDAGKPDRPGFIEESSDRPGVWVIHDLYDHAPDYVQRRVTREAQREARGETISQLRSAAAKSRWAKRNNANVSKCNSLASRQDAKVSTPAPAPTQKEEDKNVERAGHAPPSNGKNGKNQRKPPHPDFAAFKSRWCASYRLRYQTDYVWQDVKDNTNARRLLDTIGMEEVSLRCKAAFALPEDHWIAKDGLTIGRVLQFINELGKMVHAPAPEEDPDDTQAALRFLDSVKRGQT